MNVGEIRLVDDAIGKIISINPSSVILLCLKYPYFRSVRPGDALKYKKLSASLEDFQTLVDLPTQNLFTLTRWKTEINTIVEQVIEDYEDQSDDLEWTEDSEKADFLLKSIIKSYVIDSDWIKESIGQEKAMSYSVNYLEVMPEDILKLIPSGSNHRWQAVRKASAIAHLSVDIYKIVKQKLRNDL